MKFTSQKVKLGNVKAQAQKLSVTEGKLSYIAWKDFEEQDTLFFSRAGKIKTFKRTKKNGQGFETTEFIADKAVLIDKNGEIKKEGLNCIVPTNEYQREEYLIGTDQGLTLSFDNHRKVPTKSGFTCHTVDVSYYNRDIDDLLKA